MKKSILIGLMLAWSVSILAIPAKRGAIPMVTAGGDTIPVFLYGNESFHWMTDAQGQWLATDEQGNLHTVEALSAEEISQRLQATQQRIQQATQTAAPLNIAPRGLIILVSFADDAFATDYAEMDSMINGVNYVRDYTYRYWGAKYTVHAEGSARRYFIDQSMGQYQPQFDVVGPYTLSQNCSYYGSNNDANAYKMIIEGCQLADADGVDFTQYDCNSDGTIDFVFVIYAGYGEADGGSSSTVWPHSSDMTYYGTYRFDGKVLNHYACANEMNYTSKVHTGIGTFVHEFSHVLGFPDLYATNSATHKTLGEWDVLDYGPYNNDQNTPPSYSAYERFFLDWLTPNMLNKPASPTLQDIQTSNRAFMVTSTGESNLIGNNPNPTEFFLIENRQQTGWDEYIPGHGMLITKVKYNYTKWTQNTVNNSSSNMGVDIIEADGKATAGSSGKAGDAFPKGADEYTPYDDYPITDIEETDGVISFDFMGGADYISALAIETACEQDTTHTYTVVVGVYDYAGHLLREATETQPLNLNDLPAGAYILRVATEQPTADNRKTVKYRGIKITIR